MICLAVCGSAYAEDFAGEFKNGIYTNSALGAEAYLGDNWRVLSRDETAKVAEASTVFYAMLRDGSARLDINVNVMESSDKGLAESADKLVDAHIASLSEKMSKAYSNSGFKDFKVERTKCTFLGSECSCLYIALKADAFINVYHKIAVCVRGRYVFYVGAVSMEEDITDMLLSTFRKPEKQ